MKKKKWNLKKKVYKEFKQIEKMNRTPENPWYKHSNKCNGNWGKRGKRGQNFYILISCLLSVIFGAQENKICHRLHFCFSWSDRTGCHDLSFLNFEFQVSFFTPLSPSSGGSLVHLHFLSLDWYHLHVWGCWFFSWQPWFQTVIHPHLHFAWYTLHRS